MRHLFIGFLLFALNLSHVGAQKLPPYPNNSNTLQKGNRFYDDAARANMRHIADDSLDKRLIRNLITTDGALIERLFSRTSI